MRVTVLDRFPLSNVTKTPITQLHSDLLSLDWWPSGLCTLSFILLTKFALFQRLILPPAHCRIWEDRVPVDYQTLLKSASLYTNACLWKLLSVGQKKQPLDSIPFVLFLLLMKLFYASYLSHHYSPSSLKYLFNSHRTSLHFYCNSKHMTSEQHLELILRSIYHK